MAEVKDAYHRVLLASHPDKQISSTGNANVNVEFDIALLKTAYLTLSDPVLRAEYDISMRRRREEGTRLVTRPRPAQIISLDDFTECSANDAVQFWSHVCRCGGSYVITEDDIEDERHMIACERCSEVIYVGYEVLDEDNDQ